MSEQQTEKDAIPLWLRWWQVKAWFHRCPECKHRPDEHYASTAPRWENDKIAAMLGIGKYGCRRCGHGAIAERDRDAHYTCPTACVEQNHPGQEHHEWRTGESDD